MSFAEARREPGKLGARREGVRWLEECMVTHKAPKRRRTEGGGRMRLSRRGTFGVSDACRRAGFGTHRYLALRA